MLGYIGRSSRSGVPVRDQRSVSGVTAKRTVTFSRNHSPIAHTPPRLERWASKP